MVAKIFSRLDYTVTIPYGDTEVVIPPLARNLLITDEKKLGDLPKGIQLVKERKLK